MSVPMRAKLIVANVIDHGDAGDELRFRGIAASAYPEDGTDEDNTFAKFTPSVELRMVVNNPALKGQYKLDDTFYVDFTPVTK